MPNLTACRYNRRLIPSKKYGPLSTPFISFSLFFSLLIGKWYPYILYSGSKLLYAPTDGSNWIMSLGSFWTGIKEVQLSSSTGKLSSSTVTALAQRTADSGAIEASVIFKNGSFYYLFTSWDLCCKGTSSTYNIRVGRSTS